MANEKSLKFVRALRFPGGSTTTQSSLALFKLLYEFWGFCVNGTNDLRIPGGFASNPSGALTASYVSMPAGFESGSSLLASGSDGVTSYGDTMFQAPSVNWTSGSIAGKYLVTWKSGSMSQDDGIYPIVSVLGSSSISVDTNTGGTPISGSGLNKPRFTSRTNVNFRVIDLAAAMALPGFASPNHMVFQFNGPAINVGQARSQAKLTYRTNLSFPCGNISLSQSGSWNGASFNDATPELPPDTTTADTIGASGSSGAGWYNLTTAGNNYVTLIADTASLLCESHGVSITNSLAFHIEIPTRLYPADKDPNPICAMSTARIAGIIPTFAFTVPAHFNGWMCPNPLDNVVVRRYHATIKSMSGLFSSVGSVIASLDTGDASTVRDPRFSQAFFNTITKQYSVFDVVLAHRETTTSYCMGRVQLRRAAFITGPLVSHSKIGTNGDWLAVDSGILWPWDNAQLPYGIFSVAG